MSSEKLARLVEFGGLNAVDSLLVTRHGRIVLEATYAPFRAGLKHHIYSSTKSVTSTLVGMALGDGALDNTERKALDFFPGRTIANLDDAKKAITVQHLLDMTSGLAWTEGLSGPPETVIAMIRSPDWVQFVLDRPMATAPGERFYYDSGNSHLLSAILTTATRSNTWRFANDTLGKPLGFSFPQWPQDPQGIYFGGNDMLMTPRQMVAFGELYLNRGRAGGAQVVPESWVDQSLVPRGRSPISGNEYGYGWWIREMGGQRAYYAWGFGGQYIFVVPDLEMVVVTTSASTVAEDRRSHRVSVFDLVEQLIRGA